MKIDHMYTHLNVWKFFTSWFKIIIVDLLQADEIFLNSESFPPYHLSNLKDVQRHEEANKDWHDGRDITFHKVILREIHLTVVTSSPIGMTSLDGKLPDIYHE